MKKPLSNIILMIVIIITPIQKEFQPG